MRKCLVAPSDVTWPYYRPLPRQLHPSRAPPGSPARLGRVQLGAARLSSTRRSLRRIEDGDRRVGSGRRRALHRQPLPRWRRPWNIGASRPLGSSTVSTQSTRLRNRGILSGITCASRTCRRRRRRRVTNYRRAARSTKSRAIPFVAFGKFNAHRSMPWRETGATRACECRTRRA